MGSIAGISPAYAGAMAYSNIAFSMAYGQGLSAAFGGNMTPGPINTLINSYLGPQLAGGGFSNLAGLLPNYTPGGGYSPLDYTFGAQTSGAPTWGAPAPVGYGWPQSGGCGLCDGFDSYAAGYGPFSGWGSPNDGRSASPFPTSPFEISLGHHADPYFPGGVRGGPADLMAMLATGLQYLARQVPLGPQHVVNGGPIIEALG